MAADPKPIKRHRASKAEWELLRKEFEHQPCIACAQSAPDLHHIIPRSQGGDDALANLAPICRTCHTRLEGHGPRWEDVAARVRSYVWHRQSRLSYVIDKVGLARFDARYPAPAWLALGDLARSGQPDRTLQDTPGDQETWDARKERAETMFRTGRDPYLEAS